MGGDGDLGGVDPDVGADHLRARAEFSKNSGPFSLKENDAPRDVSLSWADRADAGTGFPRRCF